MEFIILGFLLFLIAATLVTIAIAFVWAIILGNFYKSGKCDLINGDTHDDRRA